MYIFDFVNELPRDLNLTPRDLLVSYAVSSLYTNEPLHETIKFLADWALRKLSIPWHFVRADQRCSDGVPLRPLLASVFMSSIKEKLDIQSKLPPYYRRYVHDTLYMMPDLSTAKDFLNTLNHTHPAMKLTMEVKNYGMSPSSVFNS